MGEVSWYGIAERGQPTANGEPMDPQALTAAHRTLPFGTVVEVTVLATGRHIRVRINDRGPFSRGRILDLSHEAARRLGIVRQGVARASIRVVGHAYPPTGFAVQVGAFRELAGANQLADALRSEGWDRVVLARNGGGSIHRVRITGFRDRAEARETVRRLRTRGYEAFIVPEDS